MILRYSMKSSTSTLSTHLRMAHGIETVTTKSALKRSSNIMNRDAPVSSTANRKTTLGRRIALMMIRDLQPFSIVNGAGFKDFLLQEKVVNNVAEIPSDRTLANSAINDFFVICEDHTKRVLAESPSALSIELDMSTTTNGNVPLITINVSYINNNGNLQFICLGTELFVRPHSGDCIANIVNSKLSYFGIQDRKYYMTGDNGRNVINSAEKINGVMKFFHCIGHGIHLTLMKDLAKHANWNIVGKVIDKVRKSHGKLCYQLYNLKELKDIHNREQIFAYLKECEESLDAWISDEESPIFEFSDTDINDLLAEEFQNAVSSIDSSFSSFKQPNATRWYSSYQMLKTYHENIGE